MPHDRVLQILESGFRCFSGGKCAAGLVRIGDRVQFSSVVVRGLKTQTVKNTGQRTSTAPGLELQSSHCQRHLNRRVVRVGQDAAECFMSPSSHRCTQLSRSAEASPQGIAKSKCENLRGRLGPEVIITPQSLGNRPKCRIRNQDMPRSAPSRQPDKQRVRETASDSRAGSPLLAAAPVDGSQE